MKQWIGRWLIGVAALHTAVALAGYGTAYVAMATQGIVGAGLRSAANAAASWFLLFGALAFAAGIAIASLERTGHAPPKSLGLVLLLMSVLGVVLMPVSGFWLVFPPAIAILWPVRPAAVQRVPA